MHAGRLGRGRQAAEKTPQEGLLLAAFGTSVPEALPSFKAVDQSFRQNFPDQPVVWAYTSQIIRRKLAKEGRRWGASATVWPSLPKRA